MGLYPAPRMQHRSSFAHLRVLRGLLLDSPLRTVRRRRESAPHTPAGFLSGTHKNLQRLVICPIYSVVKYRPHQLSLITPPERVWVLLTPECRNPGVPPTQCSAPSNFHRTGDTDSVVALTPNIKLAVAT